VDDQVVVQRRFLAGGWEGFIGNHLQLAEGDAQVVGIDELLSFEFQCGNVYETPYSTP
jgi:hypothetical protein